MFFLTTFRSLLIAMAAVSMLMFIFLGIFFYNSSRNITELSQLKYEVKSIEGGVLLLRRNEKDFLARNDLKYQAEYQKNFQKLISSVDKTSLDLEEHGLNGDRVQALKNILNKYSENFTNMVSIQ